VRPPIRIANDKRWCFAWFQGNADVASWARPALQRTARWERDAVITVTFLDGDEGLTRVRDSAWQWVSPGLANLQLAFLDSAHAGLRISIRPGNGSW